MSLEDNARFDSLRKHQAARRIDREFLVMVKKQAPSQLTGSCEELPYLWKATPTSLKKASAFFPPNPSDPTSRTVTKKSQLS